jgi:hypothetical protein
MYDSSSITRRSTLDLHRELQKIDYSQQTQAALQNFETLLLLEIQLLLGCDIEW